VDGASGQPEPDAGRPAIPDQHHGVRP